MKKLILLFCYVLAIPAFGQTFRGTFIGNGGGIFPANPGTNGTLTTNDYSYLRASPTARLGMRRTPLMMFNQYHSGYGTSMSITNVQTVIGLMQKYYVNAGYNILGIYSEFSGGRAADNSLVLNPALFPNGTSNTFLQIITNNLIPAVYTEDDPGPNTDGSYCTAFTNIDNDAFFFNAWGIGVVRIDDQGFLETNYKQNYYHRWATALDTNQSSIIIGGVLTVATTTGSLLSSSNAVFPWVSGVLNFAYDDVDYPTTSDTNVFWTQTLNQIDHALALQKTVRPGQCLELDSLAFPDSAVWVEKGRSAFVGFCVMHGNLEITAPDPATSPNTYLFLTNANMIAINQDQAQLPTALVAQDQPTIGTNYGVEVFRTPLSGTYNGNTVAASFLNRSNSVQTISVNWAQLNIPSNQVMQVQDCMTNSDAFLAINGFTRAVPAYTFNSFLLKPFAAQNTLYNGTNWAVYTGSPTNIFTTNCYVAILYGAMAAFTTPTTLFEVENGDATDSVYQMGCGNGNQSTMYTWGRFNGDGYFRLNGRQNNVNGLLLLNNGTTYATIQPSVLGNDIFLNTVTVTHLAGNSSTPTIVTNAGAGTTGATVSIAGSDLAGNLTVNSGLIPPGSSVICTVTFAGTYTTAPGSVVLTPANAATALLSGVTMVFPTPSATTFTLTSGSTGIGASTAYKWYYTVVK